MCFDISSIISEGKSGNATAAMAESYLGEVENVTEIT
jgi:hypothetical protein